MPRQPRHGSARSHPVAAATSQEKAAVSGSTERTRPAAVLAEDLPVTVRRRRRADRGATQAADDGTRQRIAGRGAYKRTTTGADRAAGHRALSWRVAASGHRQRQGSAHNK
jgi:hypothetical protein